VVVLWVAVVGGVGWVGIVVLGEWGERVWGGVGWWGGRAGVWVRVGGLCWPGSAWAGWLGWAGPRCWNSGIVAAKNPELSLREKGIVVAKKRNRRCEKSGIVAAKKRNRRCEKTESSLRKNGIVAAKKLSAIRNYRSDKKNYRCDKNKYRCDEFKPGNKTCHLFRFIAETEKM
jgi:hypothetical protein